MDLIADIGGTHARLALLDRNGQMARSHTYENRSFASLEAVLRRFLADAGGAAPDRVRLAIAAPLAGDEIAMTNIGWRFRSSELARAIGAGELEVLNDFEALARALPLLGPQDCRRIGGGNPQSGAPLAVIGPGSGLGVATAVPRAGAWIAVAGEGGHVSLPAFTPEEAAIVAEHGDPNGHCSAERLLSGIGLVRIRRTLARLAGETGANPTAEQITAGALRGEPLAARSLGIFCALLGTVAGNLALTVGARGGVFIGGGIVPKVLAAFENSDFRERFVAKGRYRDYLDAIPTAVIVTANPAFIGLKASLGFGRD